MSQLGLDLAAAVERRYVCCGMPCAELGERPTAERPFPHAPDCDNPAVLGGWVHRETGMIVRRLHCGESAMRSGECPHGGAPRHQRGLWDPYGGRCCVEVRRRERETEQAARYAAWWLLIYGGRA
jgi:hypothetical protein